MFDKFKVIVDNKEINTIQELVGVTLILIKDQTKLIVEDVTKDLNEVNLIIRNKKNPFRFDEIFYSNVQFLEKKDESIKSVLKKRNINYLYHFTNIDNLESILKHGLLTRDNLKTVDENYINDFQRYDSTNAICLSVSFPNYKMFYTLRMKATKNDWAVIRLKADILLNFDCSFFHTNASNLSVFKKDRNDKSYKTLEAFNEMFSDTYPPKFLFGKVVYRSNLNINDSYTTDPQAEVLVFENIPTKYIDRIYYSESQNTNYFKHFFSNFKHETSETFFKAREDYEHWKVGKNNGE